MLLQNEEDSQAETDVEGRSQGSISSGSGASTSHAHTSEDESFESSSEESEEASIYEVQPRDEEKYMRKSTESLLKSHINTLTTLRDVEVVHQEANARIREKRRELQLDFNPEPEFQRKPKISAMESYRDLYMAVHDHNDSN